MRYDSDTRQQHRHGYQGSDLEQDTSMEQRDGVEHPGDRDRDRPGPWTTAEDDPLDQRPTDQDVADAPPNGHTAVDHQVMDGQAADAEDTADRADRAPTGRAPVTGIDEPADLRPAGDGDARQGEDPRQEDGDAPQGGEPQQEQEASAGLKPGEAAQATVVTAIWEGGAVDGYRERWRRVQVQFLDDPAGAAEEADSLLTDVLDVLQGNLAARKRELDAWRSGAPGDHPDTGREDTGRRDTEELRVAVRSYRDLLDTVLGW